MSVIDANRQVVKLPFGSQYVITVNGQPLAKPFGPNGLKRNDRVKVKHDNYIVEVVARRTLVRDGVVEQILPQSLIVAEGGGQKMTYTVGSPCKITLGDEAVSLDVLRSGDRVKIEHEALDAKSQSAIPAVTIAAERPMDATRWTLIIAVQNYDDTRLSPLKYPLADAALLADTLTKRYRTSADQLQVFRDPSAVELQTQVPDFLEKVAPTDG